MVELSLTPTYLVVFVALTAASHLYFNERTWIEGNSFYNQNNSNNSYHTIYDIVHTTTKDYSEYNYQKNWYLLVFILPFVMNYRRINKARLYEVVVKLCMMVLLRSWTISATIPPKNETCNVKELDLFHRTIGGTCYDKMFSGHFAFGIIATFLLFKFRFVPLTKLSVFMYTLINVVHFLIITMTRSHFTIDTIIGLYVAILIHIAFEYVSLNEFKINY